MHRIRSWARFQAHGPSPLLESKRAAPTPATTSTPLSDPQRGPVRDQQNNTINDVVLPPSRNDTDVNAVTETLDLNGRSTISEKTNEGDAQDGKKKNIAVRFVTATKDILFSSWFNVLLVFVPIGIAAEAAHLNASIVFSMNAIAIVPLAGLLSHATESVAKRMGDTVGALMNVTFGNAVELIIFIALTKNEIRIVQASLLGSILANLLLILGMAFFLGGLRFREQVYNSTVTQMSACLLSLSVMSLLLPTAFHASFQDSDKADDAVLMVSRGTSVILLVVYGLYLLFQLRSHAYLYQSTPQHIIDEVSVPGPGAAWMDHSSSSDSSSSSSDSDESTSGKKRIKRMLKHRRRRSSSSSNRNELATIASTSVGTDNEVVIDAENAQSRTTSNLPRQGTSAEEKNDNGNAARSRGKDKSRSKRSKRRAHPTAAATAANAEPEARDHVSTRVEFEDRLMSGAGEARQVQEKADASTDIEAQRHTPVRQPFNLRALSVRPTLPKMLSQNVFTQPPPRDAVPADTRAPPGYGYRKTQSLPVEFEATPQGTAPVHQPRPFISFASPETNEDEDKENISRTTAVILLLVSTGLVALCADFMVEAIDAVTTGTGVSATFVGLIILPVVGNAAEHVTAVTVAIKNKMDLSIGVAVGSSIQIALFVTPFVVLLGWCMNKEMTLYFTIFETVALFVSVFVVNFLVLDGRSNYLEGALLMASYIIIAVAAYFYPEEKLQSVIGGNPDAEDNVARSLVNLLANVTTTVAQ